MKTNLQAVDMPEFELFLRIKHPVIDPAIITDTLGLKPEDQRAAGSTVSKQGLQTLHSESYWIAPLPTFSTEASLGNLRSLYATSTALALTKQDIIAMAGTSRFEMLLVTGLKLLSAHKEFLQQLNKEGGSITLLIQRHDYGALTSLHWQTLKRLGELGIGIELN